MGGKEREWVVVGRGRRGSDGVICTLVQYIGKDGRGRKGL